MEYEKKVPFVLIVEDDRDIAAYFRHVMDLAGYRTEIAANGRMAVEILHKRQPDIVLLDLSLPGIPGIEILQLIKNDESLKQTRAVVITGYSQLASDLLIEPDLVLMKPVSPGQLTEMVGRLCQENENAEKRPFDIDPWDTLTGLYNRSFFINRLGHAFSTGLTDSGNLFGVLMISLDPAADPGNKPSKRQTELFLQQIARTIKSSVRPTDTSARFGSENFLVLVENIHDGGILSIISQRIYRALDEYSAGKFPFSLGALLCDNGYKDLDEILMDVTTANSLAKKEKQNRFTILTRYQA